MRWSLIRICGAACILFFCCLQLKVNAAAWVTGTAGAINNLSNWTNGSTSPTSFTTPGDTWTVNLSMTLPSSGTWTVGTMSMTAVTVKFDTGGTLSMSGAGSTFTINIYGDLVMNGGTLSLGGAGTTANVGLYGNFSMGSGTVSSVASGTDLNITTNGNFAINGGMVTTTGASSTITLNTHGNFSMTAGVVDADGASGDIYNNIFGNCSLSGPAAMTNTGAGCTNTVHLKLPTTSGTMSIYNTSTGSWSGTNVYLDTNCTAQLAGNFSTTTGNASFGLTVDGTLICPAADTVNGIRKFTLNGLATLIVGHSSGINGAIRTTGTRTFSSSASYGFNGTAAQVTGTDMPASLVSPGKIIIDNTTGVTLSQVTTTTGTLAFTDGVLHTGTYTIITPGGPTAVTGAMATAYVEGVLTKPITGFTTVNYEVGDTSYTPMELTLSAAGTGGSFSVKATHGLHPNAATSGLSTSNMVTHYWTIGNLSAVGPTTVIPKGTYNLSDIVGGSNSYFRMQRYSGSAWMGTSMISTNTSTPYTSTPDTAVALASMAGDYIFGRVAGTLNTNMVVAGNNLDIFPNPNSGSFTLNLSSANNEDIRIVITNVLGEQVKEFTTTTNAAHAVQLDAAPGLYLLSASTASGIHTAKITIR